MTEPRLNPELLRLPTYTPGRSIDEVREAYGLDEVLKMASNENPLGPSPRALEAASRMLAQAHRYPSLAEQELRRKLAAALGHGLTPDNFLLANGATDALRLIAQAFIFEGGNAVMGGVTFPMYCLLTTAFGGVAREVAPGAGYRQDLGAMGRQMDGDTRLVFLCSPNNPTGDIITQTEMDAFLSRLPGHVVCVSDESYCDYVSAPDYADNLSAIVEGRNVLVVRSFSKSAGLANLRIGYVAGPPVLIAYLQHARVPFHVGDIAAAAAAGSLDDAEYRCRSRETVQAGRSYLFHALQELGLCALPSQANFVTIVDPPLEPAVLVEALLRRGIIIRTMAAFGLPNAVRVSVGTAQANETFVETLRQVLAEETP